MKTVFALIACIGLFATFVRAGENRSITISDDSYAAIAYSPSTGKFNYAYDRRSREAAEKEALEKCDAPDATIACWVNKGFAALALGKDKSCWGSGWKYGRGANSDAAKNMALEDCRNRTTAVHIAVALSSDGQYVWDYRENTTIIDKDGTIRDGYGKIITPKPSATPSATPEKK
jgi:uncharacterized protein DUF4189